MSARSYRGIIVLLAVLCGSLAVHIHGNNTKPSLPVTGPAGSYSDHLTTKLRALTTEQTQATLLRDELARAKTRLQGWTPPKATVDLPSAEEKLSNPKEKDEAELNLIFTLIVQQYDIASRDLSSRLPSAGTTLEDAESHKTEIKIQELVARSLGDSPIGVDAAACKSEPREPAREPIAFQDLVASALKARDIGTRAKACSRVLAALGNSAAFSGSLQRANTEIDLATAETNARITALTNDINDVTKQQDEFVKKFEKEPALDTLIKFGLPGIAGLLALLFGIVLLFPDKIQESVITSRLLLEVATVLLLIAAITVLGLADHLHNDVLGTLIGGISGYVLSRQREQSVVEGPLEGSSDQPSLPSRSTSQSTTDGGTKVEAAARETAVASTANEPKERTPPNDAEDANKQEGPPT